MGDSSDRKIHSTLNKGLGLSHDEHHFPEVVEGLADPAVSVAVVIGWHDDGARDAAMAHKDRTLAVKLHAEPEFKSFVRPHQIKSRWQQGLGVHFGRSSDEQIAPGRTEAHGRLRSVDKDLSVTGQFIAELCPLNPERRPVAKRLGHDCSNGHIRLFSIKEVARFFSKQPTNRHQRFVLGQVVAGHHRIGNADVDAQVMGKHLGAVQMPGGIARFIQSRAQPQRKTLSKHLGGALFGLHGLLSASLCGNGSGHLHGFCFRA